MLRLLHISDVLLGARDVGLGDAAPALRERRLAALEAVVDLALAERIDLVLVAGNLFASGVASRRTVERVAAAIGRLAAARIWTVILPGDADPYDRASLYRSYDLAALAGRTHDDLVTVLTPGNPSVHLQALGAVVAGVPESGQASVDGRMAGLAAATAGTSATWRIGVARASAGVPAGETATSGLHYLALGSAGRMPATQAGATTSASPGSPERVAVESDDAGVALLVTLDDRGGTPVVQVAERVVGRTRHRDIEVDAAQPGGRAAIADAVRTSAPPDPDLVLDITLSGVRPDASDVEPAPLVETLRAGYLLVRVIDRSVVPASATPLPPAETVLGAFVRRVEASIVASDGMGDPTGGADPAAPADDPADGPDPGAPADDPAELREVLRLGRRLLAGTEAAS